MSYFFCFLEHLNPLPNYKYLLFFIYNIVCILFYFIFFLRAFEQHEVTCSPNLRDTNSYWNVEDNINPKRKLKYNFIRIYLTNLYILIYEKKRNNRSYIIFIFILVPNVSFEVYSPNFFARFIESHAVMFQGNAGLKPKEGEVTSKPWQWPINYKVFILYI